MSAIATPIDLHVIDTMNKPGRRQRRGDEIR